MGRTSHRVSHLGTIRGKAMQSLTALVADMITSGNLCSRSKTTASALAFKDVFPTVDVVLQGFGAKRRWGKQ